MSVREWALVTFTILAQMSVGAFVVLGIVHYYANRKAGMEEANRLSDRALVAIIVTLGLGLLASLLHLGNPLRAPTAVTNLASELRPAWDLRWLTPVRCRPGGHQSRGLARLNEVQSLGQKTVARMDRLHVADLGGANHAVHLQVAVGRFGRADAEGRVGHFEIRRAAVGLAEDGDRLHPQLLAGPDDPQGDFPAIGHQNASKHMGFLGPLAPPP